MTLQEIIEWLKSIKEKYIHGGDEDFDKKRKIAIDIAISALEKRIPKKVKVEQFNRYNIYYCPTCDGCIGDSLGHIGDGFCSSCGQALDWSDT